MAAYMHKSASCRISETGRSRLDVAVTRGLRVEGIVPQGVVVRFVRRNCFRMQFTSYTPSADAAVILDLDDLARINQSFEDYHQRVLRMLMVSQFSWVIRLDALN